MEEKDYIDGFNQGYLIASQRPELANALSKAYENNDTGLAQGFVAGSTEFLNETKTKTFSKEHIPNHLDAILSKSPLATKISEKQNEKEQPNIEKD